MSKRDELRSKILSTHKPDVKKATLFGHEVEVRQPLLKDILSAKEEENQQLAVIKMLILYTYVPGTDEKLFEEGDVDAILEFPFGPELTAFNEIIGKMTNLDLNAEIKNSGRTDSGEPSLN